MVRPDLGGMSDETLFRAFQRGDAQAFEVILSRYRKGIYNFLYRSTRSAESAEDLYQEVFLRVVHRASSYSEKSKFSSWVYAIARNLCIDHARRMSHRRHRSLDAPSLQREDGSTLLDRVDDPNAKVDRGAVSLELRDAIAQAVETLPDDQREVFLMRHVQGMPFQAIAEVIDTPINTVKSRMRYALERLRAELGEYATYAKDLKL